jgi:hypothetical protein
VYAYEPNPELACQLRRAFDKRVTVVQAALSGLLTELFRSLLADLIAAWNACQSSEGSIRASIQTEINNLSNTVGGLVTPVSTMQSDL